MRRIALFTACAAMLLFSILPCSAQEKSPQQKLSIRFNQPTSEKGSQIWKQCGSDPMAAGADAMVNPDVEWESASLPIGNGSIGANILGSIRSERITFNEKSLWRGGPNTARGAAYYWEVNKESAHLLSDIRQAFLENEPERAAQLTRQNFNSSVAYSATEEEPYRFGNFTTMGEFRIATGVDESEISDYWRTLSLDSAEVSVQFRKQDATYHRNYFISYPDQVMVIRFTSSSSEKQHLQFSYSPNPVATGKLCRENDHGLIYRGKLDNNQMAFAIRIRAISREGQIECRDSVLTVSGSNDVVFLITADTDYQLNTDPDFDDPQTYAGVDPDKTTRIRMELAEAKGYEALRRDHQTDYKALFDRLRFELTDCARLADLPTPQRLADYRKGVPDPGLEVLYYQYGRYLLIASSRPGNLPANLQGLWHNNVDGPWHVDYHNNINLQMNYWPACPTNLGECEQPLFDFIQSLVKPGSKTAKAYFGASGWTTSISSNIFGFTTPLASEDMSWNLNPMAGPWLATHLWNYYDYTRDVEWLKGSAYDVIRGSADFVADFLWKTPQGFYTAAPTTSPEHGPIDCGTTFAHAVAREILTDAVAASRRLGRDPAKRKRWTEVLAHLAPYQTGRYGQLMEWSTDIDDPQDHHRHVNHLFGLHPGQSISPLHTPELADACRVVLDHRGDGATGWSMGWKLNQWARLLDGNRAYKLFGNLLKNGTLDNLWDTHTPFQIDGNFGGTAGVTEMLMQSHAGCIHLLPALPDAWAAGSIEGLRARGNFTVAIQWADHALQQAVIESGAGEKCIVRIGNQMLRFNTQKGRAYRIRMKNGKWNQEPIKPQNR